MSIARVQLPSVLLLLLSVVTCAEQPMTKTSSDATSTAAEPDSVAAPEKPSAGEAQAAGDTCGDVACQSSNECCKGYVCGFDPERSRVQRYCLGQ
jgi:hypothetical protein